MASKRVLCDEEAEKKSATMEVDRLSNLPEDLLLGIFSSLDAKQLIQTSITLSKTWGHLWTWIPVLDFNYYTAFVEFFFFESFINNVLRLRDQSAKLHRLSLTGLGLTDVKFVKEVLDYAFTHSVEDLEVDISQIYNHDTWPVYLENTSCDSLTSLKMETIRELRFPFMGRSILNNLRVLYLKGALITDVEPFLGFPVLERLTLIDCNVSTEGRALSVHARNLSHLTIISDCVSFESCELATPKLRYFEYRGSHYPRFRTYEGLPVLDTIVLDFYFYVDMYDQKRDFEDLLSLFGVLRTAKSIRLFSFVLHLLSLFQDELVNRSSPFQNLEFSELYFSDEFESFGVASKLKDYMLKNSPDAKFTMINFDMWREGGLVSDDVF